MTEDTTDGLAAIAFAEDILGLRLFPWQRWLLMHGLELDPDNPRLYRHRTVIVEHARQNGKTLLMVVLALWHIYCKDSRTVIATAQDLSRAEASWFEAVEWAQSDEELAAMIDKITLAHPKVLRVMHPPDETHPKMFPSEYRVAAAHRRGGRGFSGDLILLDELREHQSWDSWAAVTKTTMARPRSQVWAFSNAGDALSIVLRYQRALAHQRLGWPDGDADKEVLGEVDPEVSTLLETSGDMGAGWFEWSVPPNSARSDMTALAMANGSLNHTDVVEDCITERALLHALATDPPVVFDTECRCVWVTLCDGGPFPEGSWAATADDPANPAQPRPDTDSVVCVEISNARQQTTITRAAFINDTDVLVGVWADRAGTEWVLPYLLEQRDAYTSVVVRAGSGSPNLALLDVLIEAELPVVEWKGADIGSGYGLMFDRLRDSQITHLTHPGLDMAATSAVVKPLPAGGWIVDPIKSPSDTAPLYAAVGAVWGLTHLPDDNISIYAKEDVLVLENR